MFSKVYSGGILGIEGYLIQVEVDVSDGLPNFTMVGYLASEVREAQDRVRTALKNSGFRLPPKKVTVNLSPADVRKEGTAFDLPIAIAVLSSFGIVNPEMLKDALFAGELGLNGEIKGIHGTLSLVMAAKKAGLRRCFLPKENAREGSVIEGVEIVAMEQVAQLVEMINQPSLLQFEPQWNGFGKMQDQSYDVDYAEVHGLPLLRRATEVAVSGQHNILIIGSAGTGKSMVAKRIPTIMPHLSREESLEISKIYSINGMLSSAEPLIFKRPFRSPHHTISPQALIGGGRVPKPGEISLASRGILFLDEFPEFSKHTIENLRQPLEEHKITISRLQGSYDFPANCMLVAAMNPCDCGFYPDQSRCTCTEAQVRRYLGKISKPILDRIDICVESSPLSFEELKGTKQESSKEIRRRVERVHEIQRARFKGRDIYFNSEMSHTDLRLFCGIKAEDEMFLCHVFSAMSLSARTYNKILKVARTIADLAEEEQIGHVHLSEAIGYRGLGDKYWR